MLVEELLLPLFSDEWEETGEAARVLDGIVRILESKVDCCEGAKTGLLLFLFMFCREYNSRRNYMRFNHYGDVSRGRIKSNRSSK